mmetsp:Transcript_12546/g.34109  ORF Transcript_12546/g.34109 Transcript_12546/m.34109 type:complete len:704 (+) Transcript_12546:149-2260(+)
MLAWTASPSGRCNRVVPFDHAPATAREDPHTSPIDDSDKGHLGRNDQRGGAATATTTTSAESSPTGTAPQSSNIGGTTSTTYAAPTTPAERRASEEEEKEEEGKEEEEEDGEDTHYVSFEGDRSRVVVVDKKATFRRWLLGSAEADRRYKEVWAACQLTPITVLLGLVSFLATTVAYTCFVRDKRMFLIPGLAGVGNWYNMLTSRSPRMLRILATDFDVLFNIGNVALWAGCIGATFGWDERTAPAVLVIMMTSVMVLLSDASCSDFEFGTTRPIILLFTTSIFLSVIVLDQGGLFNDVENIVWVFNTHDGFHTTTVEAWEASNSTALTGSDGTITHHTYLRSVGNTRLLLYTLFLGSAAWASVYHPTECSILKNAARRSLSGGMEGLQLDAGSEATVDRLDDDDEVIAFMPAEGMIIPDGPKRSVLCFLLNGNHHMAKRINDVAEEHKGWGQIAMIIGLVVALVALTEVVPLNLTWLGILSFPDAARCLFKMNTQAVKLCISEPFDFLVPFVTLTVGLIGAMGSLEFHPGCCAFLASFGFIYVTNGLLFDADLTEQGIRGAASALPLYVITFIMFAWMYIMFVTGGYPSASSAHEFSFVFIRTHIRTSFLSIFTRFITTPLLFLAKFIFKKYRYGSDLTAVIKIRLIREVMPKRDLAAFLRSRDERRSSRRSALTSRRSAGRSSSHGGTIPRSAPPTHQVRD